MRQWLLGRLLVRESRPPPSGGLSGQTSRPRLLGRHLRDAYWSVLELRGASRRRRKIAPRRSRGITGHASGGASGAAVVGLQWGGFPRAEGRYRPDFSGGVSGAAVAGLPEESSWEALREFRRNFSPAVAEFVGRHHRRFGEGRTDDGGGFCGPSRGLSVAASPRVVGDGRWILRISERVAQDSDTLSDWPNGVYSR
jgi:hypothetical protein